MKICLSKKFIAVFLSLVLVLTVFAFPLSSAAATGTLGSEKPHLYATFVNSTSNEEVDGNSLTAGTYNVSIMLSGMANIATLQISADYDTSVLTVNSTSDLVSDSSSTSALKSIGVVADGGSFVAGFVSTNSNCSAINSSGQLLIKLNVTVTSDSAIDFESKFVLKTNPNATFIEADYGDYSDYSSTNHSCYALVTSFDGYTGTLYEMTADMSPASKHSVSGSLVVMTSPDGTTAGSAPYGTYTINVYSDSARTTLVTTASSVCDWTAKTNTFTISGLIDGTYYATVSSTYAITRSDITITVSGANITGAQIPVISCDYNTDSIVSINDTKIATVASAATDQTVYSYCDLNADGYITINDTKIVTMFAASETSYQAISIK